MQTTTTHKMVINQCYGGFVLSMAAAEKIARRKGIVVRQNPDCKDYHEIVGTHKDLVETYGRSDPDLIAVVEQMGEAASGPCSRLRVVEVSITIDVESNDGYENVVVSGGAY